MTDCKYGETAFNNCRKGCKYEGRENECPLIIAFYEERNKKNEINKENKY